MIQVRSIRRMSKKKKEKRKTAGILENAASQQTALCDIQINRNTNGEYIDFQDPSCQM